jgi:hypothetical protein
VNSPSQIHGAHHQSQEIGWDGRLRPGNGEFHRLRFHWPWVYHAGVSLAEVSANIPAAGTFVNYDVKVFAKGVNPGTPPTFADASVNPSGVMNRTDSFGCSLPPGIW